MKWGITITLALICAQINALAQASETKKQAAWPVRYVIFVNTESWYKAGLENWHKNPEL